MSAPEPHLVFDPGSIDSFGEEIVSGDPIGWPGYPDQLAKVRTTSGSRQAVTVGTARVQGGTAAATLVYSRFA